MSRALNALTIGAVAGWSFYIAYILWLLAHFNADFPNEDFVPGMLIPVGMLAVALWLRFWLVSRLQTRLAAALAQAVIMAAACLFITSVLSPRA